MTVDLSDDFKNFEHIEFDSELERVEYVQQKILEAAKQVPNLIIEWIAQHYPILDRSPYRGLFYEDLLRAEMVAAFSASIAAELRGKELRERLMERFKRQAIPGSA